MTIQEMEALIELAQRGAVSKAERIFVDAMKKAVEMQKQQAQQKQEKTD